MAAQNHHTKLNSVCHREARIITPAASATKPTEIHKRGEKLFRWVSAAAQSPRPRQSTCALQVLHAPHAKGRRTDSPDFTCTRSSWLTKRCDRSPRIVQERNPASNVQNSNATDHTTFLPKRNPIKVTYALGTQGLGKVNSPFPNNLPEKAG